MRTFRILCCSVVALVFLAVAFVDGSEAQAHTPGANGNNCAGPGRDCEGANARFTTLKVKGFGATLTNLDAGVIQANFIDAGVVRVGSEFISVAGVSAYGAPANVPGGQSAAMGVVSSFGAVCLGNPAGAFSLNNCQVYSNGTDTFLNAIAGNNLVLRVGNAVRGLLWDETNKGVYPLAGGSSAQAPLSGTLYRGVATGTNSTTVETTLDSFSLPAATLNSNGRGVRMTGHGNFAANGNTKTVRLKFGATDTTNGFFSGAYNGSDWTVTATCYRTGATAQTCTTVFGESGGTTRVLGINRLPAETLSGAVTLALTGQSGTASSDITSRAFFVEYLP